MKTDLTDIRDAAMLGDLATVINLLHEGIDLNEPLPNGDSLLGFVAEMGDARLNITKLLVSHGADPNSRVGGMALLSWIQRPTFCDNEQTIAFLMANGARP